MNCAWKLTLETRKVRMLYVANSITSSIVTFIMPYDCEPRFGQYWSHLIYVTDKNITSIKLVSKNPHHLKLIIWCPFMLLLSTVKPTPFVRFVADMFADFLLICCTHCCTTNPQQSQVGFSGAKKTRIVTLTRPRSSSLVIMIIVDERCSQTIRQKSQNVSGKGPCTESIYT